MFIECACRYVYINISDLKSDKIYAHTSTCINRGMGTSASTHIPIMDSCQEILRISQEVTDYMLPLNDKVHMMVITLPKLPNNFNRDKIPQRQSQNYFIRKSFGCSVDMTQMQNKSHCCLDALSFWTLICYLFSRLLQYE